jgi:hypothetical protein
MEAGSTSSSGISSSVSSWNRENSQPTKSLRTQNPKASRHAKLSVCYYLAFRKGDGLCRTFQSQKRLCNSM